MGLDMYLMAQNASTGETENIGYWRKANAVHGWFVRNCADDVDECQEIPVSRDDLRQLLKDCNYSLGKRTTEQVASAERTHSITLGEGVNAGQAIYDEITRQSELAHSTATATDDDPLPPTGGFFFGGLEKDEYYYEDLQSTIDIVQTALDLSDDWKVIYQASW